jgi:hypothetical protein
MNPVTQTVEKAILVAPGVESQCLEEFHPEQGDPEGVNAPVTGIPIFEML